MRGKDMAHYIQKLKTLGDWSTRTTEGKDLLLLYVGDRSLLDILDRLNETHLYLETSIKAKGPDLRASYELKVPGPLMYVIDTQESRRVCQQGKCDWVDITPFDELEGALYNSRYRLKKVAGEYKADPSWERVKTWVQVSSAMGFVYVQLLTEKYKTLRMYLPEYLNELINTP